MSGERNGELVFRGASAAGPVTAGTIALKALDFGDGSIDAVTMGTGSVGAYRAARFGPMVDLSLRFKIGTSPSLGSSPLVINSQDLPATYRPRMPGTDVDNLGQVEWSAFAIVNNPALAPDATQLPLSFSWANLSAIGGDAANPVGVFSGIITATASTRALLGVNATTDALLTATHPLALVAGCTIFATYRYEAA